MKVRLSNNAKEDIKQTTAYLKAKFGDQVKLKFIADLILDLKLLEKNPFIGQLLKNNYYRLVIVKQITAYYRIEKNVIWVVSLFDNRQNPDKIDTLLDS